MQILVIFEIGSYCLGEINLYTVGSVLEEMEGSHSGLVRTLGKRVWGNPPRVRISHPPQIFEKGFRTKNMVGAKRRLFCIPPHKLRAVG